jgi:hypothetical protein
MNEQRDLKDIVALVTQLDHLVEHEFDLIAG